TLAQVDAHVTGGAQRDLEDLVDAPARLDGAAHGQRIVPLDPEVRWERLSELVRQCGGERGLLRERRLDDAAGGARLREELLEEGREPAEAVLGGVDEGG